MLFECFLGRFLPAIAKQTRGDQLPAPPRRDAAPQGQWGQEVVQQLLHGTHQETWQGNKQDGGATNKMVC